MGRLKAFWMCVEALSLPCTGLWDGVAGESGRYRTRDNHPTFLLGTSDPGRSSPPV